MSWWWLVAFLAVAVALQLAVEKVQKTLFSLVVLLAQTGVIAVLYFLGADMEQLVVYTMAVLFAFLVFQLTIGRKK